MDGKWAGREKDSVFKRRDDVVLEDITTVWGRIELGLGVEATEIRNGQEKSFNWKLFNLLTLSLVFSRPPFLAIRNALTVINCLFGSAPSDKEERERWDSTNPGLKFGGIASECIAEPNLNRQVSAD